MTPEDGANRLIFHSQPQQESGAFLDMLRPYRGLRDDVFADVKASLRACAPLLSKDQLSRELVSTLWSISFFGRFWALEPDGMLRRNNLITDGEQKQLADFLGHFDYAVAMLLEGAQDAAFAEWP